MTHTPGTLEERARAIYAQFIIDNTPGAGPDDVPQFDDNAHGVRIALAAITEAADEIASLRARVEVLEKLHRSNASTMEEQRSRMIRWGKSHDELNTAINETRQALKDTPDE